MQSKRLMQTARQLFEPSKKSLQTRLKSLFWLAGAAELFEGQNNI
jgi:hypothetical protein